MDQTGLLVIVSTVLAIVLNPAIGIMVAAQLNR